MNQSFASVSEILEAAGDGLWRLLKSFKDAVSTERDGAKDLKDSAYAMIGSQSATRALDNSAFREEQSADRLSGLKNYFEYQVLKNPDLKNIPVPEWVSMSSNDGRA